MITITNCQHCGKKLKHVQFTSEECSYIESALVEYERLKDAVQWMFEAIDTAHAVVSYTSDKAITRGLNGAESLRNIRENARKAVEELL